MTMTSPSFTCLWCGTSHTPGAADSLEARAQLCPDCLGRAGDNPFLRFRLHRALESRASAGAAPAPRADGAPVPDPGEADALRRYYEARAPEYDDWYLRRGRYERGPIHDAAWAAELDAAGRWLDGLPISGEILELAAGTGWWSTLLAAKGTLTATDAVGATLDLARERLLAHGLRAHLHVRDAWAEPDRQVDAVFAGFWISHVRGDQLPGFLRLVRRWLRPGGTFAVIDSLPDPASRAADHPAPSGGRSVRRVADGREFEIVKVYHDPAAVTRALLDAGFRDASAATTGRFFMLVRATA
jgi:SAM-dependent methyltransferase